jgi:hypothetical protein
LDRTRGGAVNKQTRVTGILEGVISSGERGEGKGAQMDRGQYNFHNLVLERGQRCISGTTGEANVGIVSRKGSQHGGTKVGEVRRYEDGCTKQMGGQGRWKVADWVFQLAEERWGPHNIDRFADERNSKCKRWNSRYWTIRGEAADAFTQDWRGDNNWLVPPLRDIPRVLMYLKEQNARETILVPL